MRISVHLHVGGVEAVISASNGRHLLKNVAYIG